MIKLIEITAEVTTVITMFLVFIYLPEIIHYLAHL